VVFIITATTTETVTVTLRSKVVLGNVNNKNNQRVPICNLLGDASACRSWIRHAKQIHAASRLPDNVKYVHYDYTAQLLAMISPRLIHSLKSTVRDWEPIQRTLHVAYKRYLCFTQVPTPNNDPNNGNNNSDPKTTTIRSFVDSHE
jgi:hypothetical protein